MVYKENFKIGLKDVWKGNEISNKAILEYFENIAGYHTDSIGYGANTSSETHLNWLLLDWKLKVIKRPEYGQVLNIHTWSRKIIKCYAYRDFEIYNEKNELCVIASSKWLLINNQTRKITPIDKEIADKFESEPERKVFSEEIEKLKEPENYKSSIKYEVRRKDIDIIGHMHNLYYLDLAYETLPDDVYEKRPFNNVKIMYKKEIKLGETVICKYANVKSEENGIKEDKHVVVIKSEDEKILHSIIELS